MIRLIFLLVAFLLVAIVRAKIGYFWHITDIHYDVSYSTKGDPRKNCWKANGVPNRRPGTFGDYYCDSPWALVESAAKAMRAKHGDNLEFVLWTGDGLSGTASGRSSDMQVLALQNLTNLLSKTFPSQFVFPVLGHNDPGSSPGERLGYKDVGQFWRQWLPTEAINSFNKGGYYTIEQKEHKLRIVALNTNLYSGQYSSEDPLGQWKWLDCVLTTSRKRKETVFLVGHMAPGADERQPEALPTFQEKHSLRLLRTIRENSDIIVGQFYGHLHSDTFRVIYNDLGRPVNWMLLAPALSPKRTASGPNNPGIRLYKFETSTGQVLDYTQYYLDLNNANQRDSADWQQEYNLTSYYGLTEVTAKSLNELASTFTKHNSQLFSRYYEANSVRLYGSPEAGGCHASCAQTHYCAITRVEYSEFRNCLEAAASALASPASMPLMSSIPVVIISQLLAYYMSVT
ncbi:cyclic GMP-AMP phosphodiesterase SMPDL3A-like [Rhodnius prolixus]|uniref:cyclic GMP-AMP phosphodiesterase SMPDL3A-like n=1 Tax=Rhodnius prolixus TaxID=13249 RepID=UPI003D1884CA